MVKAMRDVVLKDLIQAELLNQEVDLFGQTTRFKLEIDELITPMSTGVGCGHLDPSKSCIMRPVFGPVHRANSQAPIEMTCH